MNKCTGRGALWECKYQPPFRSSQLHQKDKRNPHALIQEIFTEALAVPGTGADPGGSPGWMSHAPCLQPAFSFKETDKTTFQSWKFLHLRKHYVSTWTTSVSAWKKSRRKIRWPRWRWVGPWRLERSGKLPIEKTSLNLALQEWVERRGKRGRFQVE